MASGILNVTLLKWWKKKKYNLDTSGVFDLVFGHELDTHLFWNSPWFECGLCSLLQCCFDVEGPTKQQLEAIVADDWNDQLN